MTLGADAGRRRRRAGKRLRVHEREEAHAYLGVIAVRARVPGDGTIAGLHPVYCHHLSRDKAGRSVVYLEQNENVPTTVAFFDSEDGRIQ